jgi:trans-2,3-dihydro-3-hydroxyanthranilate isomerase
MRVYILKFYIVDVFAENKFEGNPLAVCIPDQVLEQAEMQKIAREINFSETTFIMSGLQDNGGYDVKIFMPDSEIPFGGHPTLGTAYIIRFLLEDKKADKIKLNLKVGQIPVTFDEKTAWMRQKQPDFGSIIDIETIAKTLQIDPDDINSEFPVQVVSTGLPSIIVNLKTLDAVNRCKINHLEYSQLINQLGNVNVHVFTKETINPENHLHARVFMFSAGYLEDPATGSSTGNLAGYLLEHNFFNSSEINASVEQGYSIGRPSLLKIKANKTDSDFSIQIGGNVFVVAEGKWL